MCQYLIRMSDRTALFCYVCIFITLGCEPAALEYDRPLVEPMAADQADMGTVEKLIKDWKPKKRMSDWPALFGPNRTSYIDANVHPVWGPEGPPLMWEVPVGTGYGSPVTASGKVVFNHRVEDQEIVACHDVRTGQNIWEFRQPTTAECNFEYSDGPYSTPIIDVTRDRVFNVSAQGRIVWQSTTATRSLESELS